MPSPDAIFEKGLPANVDAERFVLGSILVDDQVFLQVAGVIEPEDFSLGWWRCTTGATGLTG
jgi:replicative DNA helicase